MNKSETRSSPFFTTVSIKSAYNSKIENLTESDCSFKIIENREHLLFGQKILCGIPFELGSNNTDNNVLLLKDKSIKFNFTQSVHDHFLVFLHAADFKDNECGSDGIISNFQGIPRLGETVAEYCMNYTDGTCHSIKIRRRFNIGEFQFQWGTDCFECIPHSKPQTFRSGTDEYVMSGGIERSWGTSLYNSSPGGFDNKMIHWLYAAENPHTEKDLSSITFIPKDGTVFIFGITSSTLQSNPIRWEASKRIKFTLPIGQKLNISADYDDLDIDLGKIVSATPVRDYSDSSWEHGYNNQPPVVSNRSIIIEYTAHPDAHLYFGEGTKMSVALCSLQSSLDNSSGYNLEKVESPSITVKIRTIDDSSGLPVPVKLHIHGRNGEYYPPANRHRIPNPHWFEDYSVDFTNGGHYASYIDGVAEVNLPIGDVFIEVSKGFEIKPVRCKQTITAHTDVISISLKNVLPWRHLGWVTADTHVHFLSPQSALLEGSAEGVNVVNLLASQWGELFTNVGDFDGATTIGSTESGGSGEYLVRVGTENRQHILGHISLLGYHGNMILPLTTGGSNESRLGDPIETCLSDWAKRCHLQSGLNILPHFPNPRAESAASLVMGLIDGVEMTSWTDIFQGISPFSLSDWYRYLNCGYIVPAVGGSDKMTAGMPVGGVRTYAFIKDEIFTYESWKNAVRKGHTFVTYGPLLDFHINGQDMGSIIQMNSNGGTLDIIWKVSSVTLPVTKIELIINGEIRETKTVDPMIAEHSGFWSEQVHESCWVALRIRGNYPDRAEVIAAHSSVIAIKVEKKPLFNKLDAMTILEQIEGATAYVKNLGSKAEERKYKRILNYLTSAHRKLHNYMHQNGAFHEHTTIDDHHSSK